MRYQPMLAPLLLISCAPSGQIGQKVNVPALPATVSAPCKRPQAFLHLPTVPALADALGLELIQCGRKQQAAVKAYDGLAKAVIGK